MFTLLGTIRRTDSGYPCSSLLIMLIYLLGKALRQVEGTFHLLISWQICVGLLPEHRCYFNDNIFLPFFFLISASPPSIPVSAAGGAAAWGQHIVFSGQMEASQVEEVFDHLTFDGNIQRCVGVEAAETRLEPTPFVSVALPVCVCVCLTSVICWLPESRVWDSHPTWCQSRTARGSCKAIERWSSANWEHTVLTWKKQQIRFKIRTNLWRSLRQKLAVLCSVNDFTGNIRYDGLNHDVFDLLPNQGGVHSPWTKILPQGFQGPERIERMHNFLINRNKEKISIKQNLCLSKGDQEHIMT